MTLFLIRRIARVLLIVLCATFVVFFLVNLLGDPVRAILPLGTPPEVIEQMRKTLGLDGPVVVRYLDFLVGAVQGDFGTSVKFNQPALEVALRALPATLVLVVPALILGAVSGSAAGLFAGLHPGSIVDRIVTVLTFLFVSIVEFWLALMLIYLVAVQLSLVRTGGFGLDLQHMLLPVLVLSIAPFAHAAQVMRASVLTENRLAYVLTARAKGISERDVRARHLIPNAAIQVLTISIYDLSLMIVASASVEVVFGWPGFGRLAIEALGAGDIYLIEAIVVISAAIIAILGLVGDVITFRLDPRTSQIARPARVTA